MTTLIEQISHAHQNEQKNHYQPFINNLPVSYDAITPEWLTTILCADYPDAQVTSFVLGPKDDGSANRRRIGINYNSAGLALNLPKSIFCKASHDIQNRLLLGVGGAVISETAFYKHARPLLEIEAPISFFTEYDPESYNSMIILDDLTDQVESFCTHKTPINKARAMSQMDLLATLHSRFNDINEFKEIAPDLPTWPEYFYNIVALGMDEAAMNGFRAAQEVIPARLYQRVDEVWGATCASVDEHKELPSTLNHNDVHLKNWYVLPNDKMGLSDWQCFSFGHWSRDIAYVISSSLTVEDRRNWEQELIRYYLEKLAEGGINDTSFEFAWTHYKKQLLSSLAWWTGTLTPSAAMPDDIQPKDITLAMIGRIATAIDDLEAMDLF